MRTRASHVSSSAVGRRWRFARFLFDSCCRVLFSRGALLSQTRSYFYNLNELEWLHLANNKSAGIPSGVETRLMGFPAFTGGTPARPAPASFVEAAARPVYALLNLLAIDGLNPFFGDVGVVPPLPSHAPRPAAARLATRHSALCGELWVHDDGGTRTTSWSRHFNRCERRTLCSTRARARAPLAR